MKKLIPSVLFLFYSVATFCQINFEAPFLLETGEQPNNLALSDIDGDGRTDILVNRRNVDVFQLIPNEFNGLVFGEQSFSMPMNWQTSEKAEHITTADVNQDGKEEIITTDGDFFGFVRIFSNRSFAGNFVLDNSVDFSTFSGSNATISGDLNNDGYLDLATTNSNDNFISILINAQEDTINDQSFLDPVQVDLGATNGSPSLQDFDQDGKADLLVTTINKELIIRKNETQGKNVSADDFSTELKFSFGSNLTSTITGDFNFDGLKDLAYTWSDSSFIIVRENESTPGILSFKAPVKINLPQSIGAGKQLATQDLDLDGLPEIILIDIINQQGHIWANEGLPGATINENQWEEIDHIPTGSFPSDIQFADLNDDALPEIIIANRIDNTLSIFENASIITSNQTLELSSFQVNLFPNPASNYLIVKTDDSNGHFTLTIFDALGKEMITSQFIGMQKLNVQSLDSGIYWISIKNEDSSVIKKVIKRN